MTPALALHPLFAGISSEALASLERYLQTRRFEAGDIILRAGVPSAELFGLIDGAVRVELAGVAGGCCCCRPSASASCRR